MQAAVSPTPSARQTAARRQDLLTLGALLLGLLCLGAVGSRLEAATRAPGAPWAQNGVELEGASWQARRLVAVLLWSKTHAVMHAGAEERQALPSELKTRAEEIARHEAVHEKAGDRRVQTDQGHQGAESPGSHDHDGDGHEEHAAHDHDEHEEHGDHDHDEHEEHGDHDHDGDGRPDHAAAQHDEHAGHDHAGHDDAGHEGHAEGPEVLVIPPKSADFRGVIGDLERSVKPYADADGKLYSKKADQTIPFYRLMAWADPTFVQGYTVGSVMICDSGLHSDEALRFLEEGERNNPDSFEIQTELGRMYLVYKKDYEKAALHLRRALALLPQSDEGLTEVQKDARNDLFRWLAFDYLKWDRPKEAVEVARLGLRRIGEDKLLRHVVEYKGSRRLWARAAAAAEAAAAREAAGRPER
jgi:tetratricopeptide (TPR) repeat protein